MNVNIKLYSSAEALAAVITEELVKTNPHEADAFSDIRNAFSKMVIPESLIGNTGELLENYGFQLAVYHYGKRYWYRTDEMVTAIDKAGDVG